MNLYDTKDEAYRAYRESPKSFFEKYHARNFNEKDLISPDWKWFESRYHYNLVENGIIDLLMASGHAVTHNTVLDVGAGTGHWIEFYAGVLEAAGVVAVDFSSVAAQTLAERYADEPSIDIRCMDIARRHEPFVDRFDVVNAIGIMFHIVDDTQWRAALGNLVAYLAPNGLAIIGGDFRSSTRELGVMRKVRSLAAWTAALADCGAEVVGLKEFDWFKGASHHGLRNNLLALRQTSGKES